MYVSLMDIDAYMRAIEIQYAYVNNLMSMYNNTLCM